jgi:protein-tyrosine phosphatase
VQALSQGRLVAFPTEAGYSLAACALVPEAVTRLSPGPEGSSLSVVLRGAADAGNWVPEISPLGRRLTRRCWPGPITLVFPTRADSGLPGRLPEPVRRRVCPDGQLALRVPSHAAILETLLRVSAPLVLRLLPGLDTPLATTAEQAVQTAGLDAALVIDDGPCRFDRAPTRVHVNGNSWAVLEEGVISASEVERLSPTVILFVCTGNTCRSPMAEALCKKLLADRLGCPVEELPRRGFIVLSAGLAAMMGGGPAAEAVEIAREFGADLTGHVSRPVSARLVAQADFLLAMTRSHLLALTQQFPRLVPRPRLLSAAGEDLADPIGGDLPVYRACAQQILRHLEGLLPELQPS